MLNILKTKLIMNSPILYEIGFNTEEAKRLFNSIANPLTSFLLWATPFICIAACIWKYVAWAGKDEDEQEQRPIWKTIKKYIFWAIIIESLSAIMKIFGLST